MKMLFIVGRRQCYTIGQSCNSEVSNVAEKNKHGYFVLNSSTKSLVQCLSTPTRGYKAFPLIFPTLDSLESITTLCRRRIIGCIDKKYGLVFHNCCGYWFSNDLGFFKGSGVGDPIVKLI